MLKNIRSEDRKNLGKLVQALEKQGLTIYLTGSALSRGDYNDIDLVVSSVPSISITASTTSLIENAFDSLKDYGIEYSSTPYSVPDETYAGSSVKQKYNVTINDTRVHIVEAIEPFDEDLDTPREMLFSSFFKDD